MRSPEEIQAEIDHLKAEGMHPARKELRDLRAELKATQEPAGNGVVETLPADVSVSAPIERSEDPSPFDSEEWAFIQQCLAETDVIPGSGAAKKMYHRLEAQVISWRNVRRIIMEVGVGGEWPQYSTLGLDANTGKPRPPKHEKPAPLPQVQAPDHVPDFTTAGDPINPHGGGDVIAAAFAGQIAGLQRPGEADIAAKFRSGT